MTMHQESLIKKPVASRENVLRNHGPEQVEATFSTAASSGKARTRGVSSRADRLSAWPSRAGKVRMAALLWAIGVPIPIVLIFLLIRGCS